MTLLRRWWAALFARSDRGEPPRDESDLAQATTLAELEWRMRRRWRESTRAEYLGRR